MRGDAWSRVLEKARNAVLPRSGRLKKMPAGGTLPVGGSSPEMHALPLMKEVSCCTVVVVVVVVAPRMLKNTPNVPGWHTPSRTPPENVPDIIDEEDARP